MDNLTDPDNIKIQHHVNQAIKAWGIMHRDQDYVVKGRGSHHRGRVHRPADVRPAATTRACTRPSRPKEGVEVARESRTLATITFQNYFGFTTSSPADGAPP